MKRKAQTRKSIVWPEPEYDKREGWGWPWSVGHRHYFRNKKSLCGNIIFFAGDLSKRDDYDNCCPSKVERKQSYITENSWRLTNERDKTEKI